MGDNSTALIASVLASVAVGFIFLRTIKTMDSTGTAAIGTGENLSSSSIVEKSGHETSTAENGGEASESESDGDEYEDDEETDEDLEVEIKNSYSVTDGPFKMVLCINMSLSMGKGKMCAQCGHATLGAYIKAQKHCDTAILWWHRMGQVTDFDSYSKKICRELFHFNAQEIYRDSSNFHRRK